MIKKILKRPSTYFFICILTGTVFCMYKLKLVDTLYENNFINILLLSFLCYIPLIISLIIAIIANLNIQTNKKINLLEVIINFLLVMFVVGISILYLEG